MLNQRIIFSLLCGLAFVCCSNSDPKEENGRTPAMELSVKTNDATSVTLTVKTVNATHIRALCVADAGSQKPAAGTVVENGKTYTGNPVVIDGLTPETAYTIYAVACNDNGAYSTLHVVRFSTADAPAEMYAWEKERNGILSFTDLVLCYGGSRHRNPYRWEKERFTPLVTYTDQQGKEHWLFDSFLCIEFQTLTHSLMLGLKLPSGGRTQWQELETYWFDTNNGVNALEKAVEEAAKRLGTPPTKRKVIMTLPDPIIYEQYADEHASTTYWGTVDDRRLDFSKAEDRLTAYKWYIDRIRRQFDRANYRYIELAGFYIISEELASPDDGWNYELKKSDEVIPQLSEYLHSINEALCWIPYNRAAGYKRWRKFGVDYAYMQPNHFWDDAGKNPLSRFFSDIKANDLAMEFEFDEALLDGKPDNEVYKTRLREYMEYARKHGTYGSKPLSYYHGNNALYELWKSTSPGDQELYHEFCQFVLGNPLRK